jgi:hypothetical protein
MVTWDWRHTNDIEIRMNPEVKAHPTKAGVVRPVKDDNNVRMGVCASKSYLWSKRCLKLGHPPATRGELDHDSSGKLGITPASIVTQAMHAFMQRQTAKNGYDPVVWNRDMARGHGLTVDAVGSSSGGVLLHEVWVDLAIGTGAVVKPSLQGPYVITVVGPTYFHTMALFSGFQCSFFDPEKGQFSSPRAGFRSLLLGFLNTDYPGLQSWDLWKPRLD